MSKSPVEVLPTVTVPPSKSNVPPSIFKTSFPPALMFKTPSCNLQSRSSYSTSSSRYINSQDHQSKTVLEPDNKSNRSTINISS